MSDAGGNIERVSSDFAPLVTETLPMPVLPLDDTRAYGLVYVESHQTLDGSSSPDV